MDKLTFKEILRYFLSGATFIYALYLLMGKPLHNNITVLFVLALLIGCIIYVFHRSIIYPSLYKGILKCITLRKGCRCFYRSKPSDEEMDRDQKRWKRLNKDMSLQNKLTDWGSEIHFHYCITWAIAVAAVVGGIFFILKNWSDITSGNFTQNIKIFCIKMLTTIVIFIILKVSARINNLRYLWYEDKIVERESNLTSLISVYKSDRRKYFRNMYSKERKE